MRVFLIAGEPSGDALGGALMAGLKRLAPEVTFDGVGGPAMQAQGLCSRFAMSELSVMGIAEVLPKYRHLKRRIREVADAVLATKPDVLITIDSPDFCLRVARLVKAESEIRTVHYVAPSVWAWRPGRAKKMVGVIDQVLALFPFEPPLMEAHGIESDCVGHPIVAEPIATDAEVQAFRAQHGVEDADPLLLVLPGSRRGEVTRLAPVFGPAVAGFAKTAPGVRPVVVMAPNVADLTRELLADWEVEPILISGADAAHKRAAFRAADLALAASGTVALELAANDTPMVMGYRMNPLSYAIIRRMALIDTANLVNIATDTRHVPECLGPACKPECLVPALEALWRDSFDQRTALTATLDALGRGQEDPGLRAARAVLARMPSD